MEDSRAPTLRYYASGNIGLITIAKSPAVRAWAALLRLTFAVFFFFFIFSLFMPPRARASAYSLIVPLFSRL